MRFDERLGPKILVYHDLSQGFQGDIKTGRDSFRRQIELMLQWGIEFIPISQALNGQRGKRNQVTLTFDDGFSSFLENGLPVIEEYGIPSTMYCSTGLVGRSSKSVSFMTWDEIHDISARGVDIGCHCVSHIPLNEVDDSIAEQEILESTQVLRQHDLEPKTLAYPYGRYNETVKGIIQKQGYTAAVTVMIGGRDMFELRRRLVVGSESTQLLKFKLTDRYLDLRETLRAMVPDRFLKQEHPIEKYRWGFEGFDRG